MRFWPWPDTLRSAAFDVETKAARFIATNFTFRHAGKQIANGVEETGIGGGLERGVRPIGL